MFAAVAAAAAARRHTKALRCCRHSSSFSSAGLPPFKLMPMPRLSPTMRSGTVVRWLLAEGDELPSAGSEVAVEVKAHGLTEDWSAPPGTSSSPIMEVEIHEEGFVAKLLVREGEEVHPDEAIAVIVESEQSISAVQSAFAHQGGGNPSAPILVEPATFAWQVCHAAQRESCMHIFLVPCIAPR
jgi:hypothetical protein